MYRAEVLGTRAALAAGTPVIMATVHSSRVRSSEDQAALAALTPAMDRLIVPSASILAKVRSEGRGGAAYSIVPNGVDLSRFEVAAPRCALRRESGVPGSAVLVGVVARLEPEKGHTHLVAAWPDVVAAAPDTWLAIVGEGSACAALRAQAAALPAPARDRIIFTGRREDVSALTADLDIAVLPSLREAQGISILEAMARRKPVVASAVGGIPEVVADGVSGLLVPPGDPLALSAALSRLAASPALRASMGEAGYRIVVDRFSMEAHVRRIESIYDEELSRAGALASLGNGSGPLRHTGEPPRERSALEVPPV
jgi:glycosyltransferase involved in cell wall biosynthesis